MLLAKHAQHVVLIHFPIALYIAAVVVDIFAQWSKRKDLQGIVYCNVSLAAIFVLPIVATGLIAWQWALEGQKLKGILLYHLVAALTSSVLILFTWWLHFRARLQGANDLPGWRMPVEIIGVLLLMLTGHLGGFLSGVNGIP